MIKYIFIILLVSLTYSICFSQTKEKLELNKTYSLAKIYKKDFFINKVNDLILINDSTIKFRNKQTHITEYVSLSDINRLRVKSGNHLLSYTLTGAGIGLTYDLLFIGGIVTQEPSEYELKVNDVPGYVYAIPVVLCASIGAFIGLFTPKWKTVNISKQKFDISSVNIYPIVDFSTNHCLISLSMNF